MPQQGLIFRILVASPKDCLRERRIVPEIIYSWNATHSLIKAAILEPVLWETHATPALGGRPQEIINEQLVKKCDLMIGVFWTRLGTDTGVAESGTVEEIEEFMKDEKPVLLYFSSVPLIPESIDLEQYRKLIAYKETMQQKGIVFSYESIETFRELLQRHLVNVVDKLLAKQGRPSAVFSEQEEPTEIAEIKMLKTQFESFLRRVEAEWTAERDSVPSSIDDGQYILQNASSEIVSYMSKIVIDDGSGLSELFQNTLKKLKELGRHELRIDGGVSYREFWEKGDKIIEDLKKIPSLLEAFKEKKIQSQEIQGEKNEQKKLSKEFQEIKGELKWENPVYYIINGGSKDGPFCPQCYDNDKKLIRLQGHGDGLWICKTCKNSFTEKRYEDKIMEIAVDSKGWT